MRKMPRRRRKEHEGDHVGARVECDVESLGRREAAYFDDQRHGAVWSRNASLGIYGALLQPRGRFVSDVSWSCLGRVLAVFWAAGLMDLRGVRNAVGPLRR